MGIIGWIVLGLVAGIIAKRIFPGGQGLGIVMTTLLGVGGALLGGLVSRSLLGVGKPTRSTSSGTSVRGWRRFSARSRSSGSRRRSRAAAAGGGSSETRSTAWGRLNRRPRARASR